eukprot:TRINITY_DN69744_c0_g1_i1.p1 TRINITY_DN69744_c0_g1~~TRINITY_DN69744_c0_g1_i1.p1  ORF type:complete len:366 (-),score=33.97 TRINITY_DN69744_c0_g1_i1:75-1070(-)
MTNGRATDDNTRQHGTTPESPVRWNMDFSSLLFTAVGVWASRDNVFTGGYEPGCSRFNCTEQNPKLETTNALLGGGPYGPSDGLGYFDRSIIMRSCMKDGRLLKADYPASIAPSTFAASFSNGKTYHVSITESQHSASWKYVMGINLDAPYTVPWSDFESLHQMRTAGSRETTTQWVAYQPWMEQAKFTLLDKANPLVLPACPPTISSYRNFVYYALAPVLDHGWVVLGEPNKVIVASHQRFNFTAMKVESDSLEFEVNGAQSEIIQVWVLKPGGTTASNLLNAECEFNAKCPKLRVWPTPNKRLLEQFTDYQCSAKVMCNMGGCTCKNGA